MQPIVLNVDLTAPSIRILSANNKWRIHILQNEGAQHFHINGFRSLILNKSSRQKWRGATPCIPLPKQLFQLGPYWGPTGAHMECCLGESAIENTNVAFLEILSFWA